MIQLSGLQPDKDIEIQFTGLRPGEKLYEELLNDTESIIPTHHDKIMKAKVAQNNYFFIHEELNKLNELINVVASDNTIVSSLKILFQNSSAKTHFLKN